MNFVLESTLQCVRSLRRSRTLSMQELIPTALCLFLIKYNISSSIQSRIFFALKSLLSYAGLKAPDISASSILRPISFWKKKR